MNITPSNGLNGTVCVQGDKSISHRAIMFGALSDGVCNISHFLMSDDCLATIDCFRKMGVEIEACDETVRVQGVGINGLKAPISPLYTGNSGTTTRLLCGLLAAQNFNSSINGDESIQTRPMARVATPLKLMGADIELTNENFCPIEIHGTELYGIDYTLPVASAQLKSALILAGLYANGKMVITEQRESRNHTEHMLKNLGANIEINRNKITVEKTEKISSFDLDVPGDISSAAFFIVAGLIVPNSEIILKNVGINKTRAGVIDLLIKMGGDITITNRDASLEPTCDLIVKSSKLKAIDICGDIIPNVIDELPILAVAASFAEGKTNIRDASELRHKESDRISAMCTELKKGRIDVVETPDGMIINGGEAFGGDFISYNDHRIAMAMTIFALAAKTPSSLSGEDAVSISYPNFFNDLNSLRG
ncbi:MAG: 3-phosphoshikimate 1-carboxyvinyltransferase [Clostridia bacterium]|nr:3-phosphoshikimate 1-carboxyvinyltransferase [Clostridia bacterium]